MTSPVTRRRRDAIRSIASAAALAALPAAFLAGCDPVARPAFRAIDITGADYARGFELPDAEGRTRRLSDFAGQVVVVFFGFTQCPDVCPTTLAEVAQARQLLGPEGARVQAVFITVDPARDTPEVLSAYLRNFDPAFVGLRGSDEQTAAVAREFKVYYKKVPGRTESSYTMDHTAASYVFDPRGRIRLYARYGSGAQALAEDIRLLLREAG